MEIALAKIMYSLSSQEPHVWTLPGAEMVSTMTDTTIAEPAQPIVRIVSIRLRIALRVRVRSLFTTLISVIVLVEMVTIRLPAVHALLTHRIAALQLIKLASVMPVWIHLSMMQRQTFAVALNTLLGMKQEVYVMIAHLGVILVQVLLSAQVVRQATYSMKPWVFAIAIQLQLTTWANIARSFLIAPMASTILVTRRASLVTLDVQSVTFWMEDAMNVNLLISSLRATVTSGADYLKLCLNSNLVILVVVNVHKTRSVCYVNQAWYKASVIQSSAFSLANVTTQLGQLNNNILLFAC